MHVLLVEDDPAVRDAVARALRGAGHEAEPVSEGRRALEMARVHAYDAIVLDLGLPGLDGLEVCRALRADGSRVPILILTARSAVSERVAGLDAGADDYVVKPFALGELLARLRVFERRALASNGDPVLRFGDLRLDRETMECWRAERKIELSRTEYRLLALFMTHPRKVLSRSVIFEEVWQYDFGPGSNSLDVYVGYLRRKLETGGEPRLLQTVRGVGYVLREE